MINSQALRELLKKVTQNSIDTVFICNTTGEILCLEGKDTNQTISDIISNMWTEYGIVSEELFKDEKMNYLLIENSDSNLVSGCLFGYLITMKAGLDVELGMIKRHLDALIKNLKEVLEPYKEILERRNY